MTSEDAERTGRTAGCGASFVHGRCGILFVQGRALYIVCPV